MVLRHVFELKCRHNVRPLLVVEPPLVIYIITGQSLLVRERETILMSKGEDRPET